MSQCLEGLDVLDERGYVLVDKNMETKVKGIYAAGDVLQKIFARLLPQPMMELSQLNIYSMK